MIDKMNDANRMSQVFNVALSSINGSFSALAVSEFNNLLSTFIVKLQGIYAVMPELQQELKTKQGIIEELIKDNAAYVIEQFYVLVAHHVTTCELDDKKRDDFIMTILPQISIMKSLQITNYWQHTNEQTRHAIWQYIKQLWLHSYNYHHRPSQDEFGQRAMQLIQQPGFYEQLETAAKGLVSLAGTEPEVRDDMTE